MTCDLTERHKFTRVVYLTKHPADRISPANVVRSEQLVRVHC